MNNLNSRERTLLIIVLCFIPLGALYYGWTKYQEMRAYRQNELLTVENRIVDLKNKSIAAQIEGDRYVDAYNEASLPFSVAEDTTLYRNFLENLISRSNLERVSMGATKLVPVQVEIQVGLERVKETVYDRVMISDITLQGKLADLVDFLYHFHDLAILHRIDKISVSLVSPDKEDDTNLSIKLTVSGAILPSGPETKKWSEYAVGRLGKPREAYDNLIVARDLFGPPNFAPRITSPDSKTFQVGDDLSHRVVAADKNVDDRLTFELVSADLEGVELRPERSGNSAVLTGPRLTTPGRYRFQVRVSDNRLPLLTAEQFVTVNVPTPTPPKPEKVEKPEPPRKYAPDTRITAVLQGRVSTVNIHNRATDEAFQLREGQSFELDRMTWTVVKIVVKTGQQTVSIRVGDELREFQLGSSLDNPVSVSKALTATDPIPK